MTGPVDIGTIVTMLADRAEPLARELLPDGHREGANWREAKRDHGGLGDSFSVCIRGGKAGVWQHAAAGRAGDALDLVAYLLFRDDKGRAIAWARSWLGIDGLDPARLEQRRRQAEATAKKRDAAARAEAAEKRRSGQRIFLAADADLQGTPVAAYLAARGLDLRRLGRYPSSIRYARELWCAEAGRNFPAMVAAIVAANGDFLAVHRTWLDRRAGVWGKADLEHAKKTLGDWAGGCIRLWRGERLDPKTGEIKPGRHWRELAERPDLVGGPIPGSSIDERWTNISEGIEDGLTAALAMKARRVLAAVSIDNIGNLALPPVIERVTLLAQNDPACLPDGREHPTQAALRRAIARLQADGREVFVSRPRRADCKDINKLLTEGAA